MEFIRVFLGITGDEDYEILLKALEKNKVLFSVKTLFLWDILRVVIKNGK